MMRGLFGALAGSRGGNERKETTRYGIVDQMWADFFGGYRASKSGVSVNWKSALSVSTVLACARVRGEALSTPPWKLYRKQGGKRTEATNHPLYDMLQTAPNDWMTSLEMRETMAFHIDLRGDAFVWKSRLSYPDGQLLELIVLDRDRVSWKQKPDYSMEYTLSGLDGSQQKVGRDQIWHIKGPSWDTIAGLDIIALAREAIGLAIAAEESQAAFMRNGVQPSGMIAVEGALNESQTRRLSAWVRRHFGGAENAGKLMTVDRNAKFTPFRMTGVEAQQLETRKFQVEQICQLMRVMPIMIGFQGDKNATFASAEQMFNAHLIHTARPIWRRVGQSADLHLLTRKERAQGLYTGFVEADFISAVLKDKAEYYKIALGGGGNPGWMTPNEARAFDEQPAHPGGDHLYVGVNTAPIGPDGRPMTPDPKPAIEPAAGE